VRWEQVFLVFVVCHMAGDFLLQTDWQALNKRGGLFGGGPSPVARRALLSHVFVYTLVFVPAIVWVASETTSLAYGLLALVFIPHLVQDDGRVLMAWNRQIKHGTAEPGDMLYMAIDQSFHVVTLFGTALLVVA
jgi:hypothetical protein